MPFVSESPPLLSTGSLRTMVPPLQRYYGTLRLPAVHLGPFRILHESIPPFRPSLLPSVVGVPPGAWNLLVPALPIRNCDGNDGVSQVPWKPGRSLSVLYDPGRIRLSEWTMVSCLNAALACAQDEGSKPARILGAQSHDL